MSRPRPSRDRDRNQALTMSVKSVRIDTSLPLAWVAEQKHCVWACSDSWREETSACVCVCVSVCTVYIDTKFVLHLLLNHLDQVFQLAVWVSIGFDCWLSFSEMPLLPSTSWPDTTNQSHDTCAETSQKLTVDWPNHCSTRWKHTQCQVAVRCHRHPAAYLTISRQAAEGFTHGANVSGSRTAWPSLFSQALLRELSCKRWCQTNSATTLGGELCFVPSPLTVLGTG